MAEIFAFPSSPEERKRKTIERGLRADQEYFNINRGLIFSALNRQRAFSEQFFTSDNAVDKTKRVFFAKNKDTFSKKSLKDLHAEAFDIDEAMWANNPRYATAFLSAFEDRVGRCGGVDEDEGPDDVG